MPFVLKDDLCRALRCNGSCLKRPATDDMHSALRIYEGVVEQSKLELKTHHTSDRLNDTRHVYLPAANQSKQHARIIDFTELVYPRLNTLEKPRVP